MPTSRKLTPHIRLSKHVEPDKIVNITKDTDPDWVGYINNRNNEHIMNAKKRAYSTPIPPKYPKINQTPKTRFVITPKGGKRRTFRIKRTKRTI